MAAADVTASLPEIADPPTLHFGEFKFSNGGRYRGQYILEPTTRPVGDAEGGDGEPPPIEYRKIIHGEGEYRNKGHHFKGMWHRGARVCGTQTFKNGDSYTGHFDYTDRKGGDSARVLTNTYQGFGGYVWCLPMGRHQKDQTYEGMWHSGKMHGFGKYSHFVEGVNCKEFYGVSLEGLFDSGRQSAAEYMSWYRSILESGLREAMREVSQKVAALTAEGLNPDDPTRQALATEHLMADPSEQIAPPAGDDEPDPQGLWTQNPPGVVEAPAGLTSKARESLPTVRALVVREKMLIAIGSRLGDSTDAVEQSEGAEADNSGQRVVFEMLTDEDAKGLIDSPQLRISHQVARVSIVYPDPRGDSAEPLRGYMDFLNINEDAVDGCTCEWRLLRVNCGYEDSIDETAEFEALVSGNRGGKGKKK
ncbi:hypothetical protein FOL46_000346 [Perkinsus olseni]|nr:hypothetical protein FOL46_000346 [Perkinsus olseni]